MREHICLLQPCVDVVAREIAPTIQRCEQVVPYVAIEPTRVHGPVGTALTWGRAPRRDPRITTDTSRGAGVEAGTENEMKIQRTGKERHVLTPPSYGPEPRIDGVLCYQLRKQLDLNGRFMAHVRGTDGKAVTAIRVCHTGKTEWR